MYVALPLDRLTSPSPVLLEGCFAPPSPSPSPPHLCQTDGRRLALSSPSLSPSPYSFFLCFYPRPSDAAAVLLIVTDPNSNQRMSSYYKRTHPPPSPSQPRSFSTSIPSSHPPAVLDKDRSEKPPHPSPSSFNLPQDPVITVSDGDQDRSHSQSLVYAPRPDKASRVLGIKHRRSMEPIPASTRTSVVSSHSARPPPAEPTPSGPTFPLTTLYIVSGLPKSPHTWTLADPDSVLGLHHSEGAVNRWWRPEVLGSTVSPGAGGGSSKRNRKKGKVEDGFSSAGYLSKQDVGKILSKALKVSFSHPL